METINHFAQMWWTWMGDMLWQVSLFILIIGLIDLLTKSWLWPQVRHALWLLVFIKLIIPPTWSLNTSIISHLRPQVEERITERLIKPASETIRPSAAQTTSQQPGMPSAGTQPMTNDRPQGGITLIGTIFLIWLTGVALFFALLTLQMIRLRRWHDQQKEREIPTWFYDLLLETCQKMGRRRLPAIVFHDKAKTPAVYGIFRPVMLLPVQYFDHLSPQEAQHVLLHELAHIKRGDLWLHGFALLLQIVYWINPLMIWVRQQVKHVREMCCDLTVATILREKTLEYRQTLLNTARGLLTEKVEPGLGLLGVAEEPFRLISRLKWLEKETYNSRPLYTAASIGAFIIIASLLLPMESVGVSQLADTAGGQPEYGSAVAEDHINSTGQASEGCYFIKELAWTEEYKWWSKANSTFQEPSRFYLCQDKASLTQDNLTCILDVSANTFTLISHRTESYVVMDLPLDIPGIWSDELRWIFKQRTTSGTVVKTRQHREINSRKSQLYKVTYWPMVDGKKNRKSATEVWASTEVPFDIGLHEQVLFNLRRIYNRDADLQQELLKIKGAQMRVTVFSKQFPMETRYCSEIMDIIEQAPPVEAFVIPADYTQKEQIEPRDLGI